MSAPRPAPGGAWRAARGLKARLAAGECLVGGLLRMPAESLVEMAGVAGMDYLVIDCEHGPADTVALQRHLTAAQAFGTDVLVRVGRDEPGLVLRALDLGATGVIVPHVDDADDARRAVRDAHYPPLGDRGFATYTRAGRFGTVSGTEHLRRMAESTVVVVMVESAEGCRNAADVLRIEGVDGVLVGPADLAVSLGGPTTDVQPAVATVHEEAARAGRSVMTIVSDTAAAERAREKGVSLVLYNLAAVLQRTLGELVDRPLPNRGGAGGDTP